MLVKRFESHLKENGKQPNTVSYYMRNLRVIYNRAIETKRLLDTGEKPFADVFTGVEETKRRALSAVEVNRLYPEFVFLVAFVFLLPLCTGYVFC